MLKSRNEKMDYIYAYLLSNDVFANNIIQCIGISQKRPVKKVGLTKNRLQKLLNINIGIEDWLTNISIAKFLITDSFHGCVFSIIFNTDFVVLENKAGGNTRIESLLRLFNLSNRIIHTYKDYEKAPKIDWNDVNQRLMILKKKSINFLKENLSQNPSII